jgi:hypothetical protein
MEALMLDIHYGEKWDAHSNRWFTTQPHGDYCWGGEDGYPECLYTNVVAVTGPGTAFDDRRGRTRLADIDPDTVLVIEVVDSGIFWAEPGDLPIDDVPNSIVNGLDGDGVRVLFADGEVWLLRNDVPLEDLKKFFTIEGAMQYDREQVLRPYADAP